MSADKIIALVKYAANGASSRVRFWNLGPLLAARGYNVQIFPLLTNQILAHYYSTRRHSYTNLLRLYFDRLSVLCRRERQALYWIEKEMLFGLPAPIEALLGPDLGRCIFDYDDAVFLNYNDRFLGPLGRVSKFARYARSAAHVTVGSEFLYEHMVALGCRRITKISSTVFVDRYPVRKHDRRDAVVIGWIGTPVTVEFLNVLKDPLRELAKKVIFQLRIVGAEWSCPGVNVNCYPWSEMSEASLVGEFDIGIMPLIDGHWERAKCSYKLIQYMAAGVVPVGSSVGENVHVIDDGVDGLLAGTSAEWLEKLEMLCRDVQLRVRLGRRARAKALAKYDVSRAVEAMDRIFQPNFERLKNRV